MSGVVFRRVTTALQTKSRAPGGMRIAEAVLAAEANLKQLEPQAAWRLAAGVAELTALASDGEKRPSPERLQAMVRLSDVLLGCCTVLDRPGLADCLKCLGRLSEAVAGSELWLAGTFRPVVAMVSMASRRSLHAAEIDVLVRAVDQCMGHYQLDQV